MSQDGVREAEDTLIRMAAGVHEAETLVVVVVRNDGGLDYLRHGSESVADWLKMVGALDFVKHKIIQDKLLDNVVPFE